jgi:hypothetical protein
MNHSLQEICQTVQYNCHVADARHGGDFTMCTYLLKMREYFRWERGAGIQEPLPREELGEWLQAREALWEELAEAEFRPLTILGNDYDPFDTCGINAALEPLGVVYSAGLVNGAKAHFFIGELLQKETPDEAYTLHLCGAEYARCLNAPPAMASDAGVFLRREALRRYLWEKYESWLWNRPDNALGRAFACYDFATDPERALEAMTDAELAAAREHELGEFQASQLLGEAWNRMLMDLVLTPAELMARAVKDHLADSLRTLPMLIEKRLEPSLHFYIGNLSGMRLYLNPELKQAYEHWLESGNVGRLRRLSEAGRERWHRLAEEMLRLHRECGSAAADPIRQYLEACCAGEAGAP